MLPCEGAVLLGGERGGIQLVFGRLLTTRTEPIWPTRENENGIPDGKSMKEGHEVQDKVGPRRGETEG